MSRPDHDWEVERSLIPQTNGLVTIFVRCRRHNGPKALNGPRAGNPKKFHRMMIVDQKPESLDWIAPDGFVDYIRFGKLPVSP
tara:strand:+ start:65 stop:313 length:249 start_codon:yes stop_codon:yes gene_type:complete